MAEKSCSSTQALNLLVSKVCRASSLALVQAYLNHALSSAFSLKPRAICARVSQIAPSKNHQEGGSHISPKEEAGGEEGPSSPGPQQKCWPQPHPPPTFHHGKKEGAKKSACRRGGMKKTFIRRPPGDLPGRYLEGGGGGQQ